MSKSFRGDTERWRAGVAREGRGEISKPARSRKHEGERIGKEIRIQRKCLGLKRILAEIIKYEAKWIMQNYSGHMERVENAWKVE